MKINLERKIKCYSVAQLVFLFVCVWGVKYRPSLKGHIVKETDGGRQKLSRKVSGHVTRGCDVTPAAGVFVYRFPGLSNEP